MNLQPPESYQGHGSGLVLDVHSMFLTIQGEGPYAGHRAVFVRLAGCNLQCPGCDTEYTEGRREVPMLDLASTLINFYAHVGLVVITGGEPLRQAIGRLVTELVEAGKIVQIESNGMFAPDEALTYLLETMPNAVHLVVSPKTAKINHVSARLAKAFKYVLDYRSVDPDDGLPIHALEHEKGGKVARPRADVPVYLNPFDAKDDGVNKLNLDAVARSCISHGHIMGVQMHKLANLE